MKLFHPHRFLSGLRLFAALASSFNAASALDRIPAPPSGPVWEKISPLLDQSIAALTAGDATRAEELRQEALGLSGFLGQDSIPPATTLVAHAERALKAGLADAAIIDYRESLAGTRLTTSRVPLAKLLIAKGETDEVITCLNEVHRPAAEYGIAQLLLGKTHLARYQQTKSIDDLADASLTLNPPTRSAKTVLTPEWMAPLKELQTCIKALSSEQRTALTAARSAHRLTRAKALIDEHEKEEAFPLLNELLAEDPFCAEAYDLRQRISDYEPARNEADASIATELRAPAPDAPQAGDEAALALAEANLLVHQRPFDAKVYVKRMLARLSVDRPTAEQAEAAYKDAKMATALDAYDPQTFQALCEAFIAQRRALALTDRASFEERDRLEKAALWAAESALALSPKEVGLLIWRAKKQQDTGGGTNVQNAAHALLFLNQAVSAAPTNLHALYARATTAHDAENYAQSADDYRALIRLAPNVAAYSYNLGWVLMAMDQFHAAAIAFDGSAGRENVPDDARSLQALMLAFADDPKAEELANSIPEHSVYSGGVSTAHWNVSHNNHRNSPLIERVNQRLYKATKQ